MGSFFGSLGDKLGYKQVPCRVRGCTRTWPWNMKDGLEPPARMCDECHARLQTLADRQLPCATAGCGESSTWTRYQQLEAWVAAAGQEPAPPRRMCDACREKAKALGDQQVPCRVKTCARTWTWTGKAQLAAGGAGAPPPSRMCDECHARYEQLRDRKLPCKIAGCGRHFLWTRWMQLEAERAGKTEAPERMCDECQRLLASLHDVEVPCRTEGCGGTWIWRRGQQLEARRAQPEGELAPPARMCPACQSKFSQLEDLQVPCKRSGCKHTWLYKRGAQLERWVRHGEGPDQGPPARLCDACRKALDDFADREVACKNEGCTNTWTWTRFAQLQAREQGHGAKPPAHMCEECKEFLKDRRTKTITCATCGAAIHWAPELQLKTKLGLLREPTLCGACKSREARA